MRVTITRGDDLAREVWVFVLSSDRSASVFRLSDYRREERKTKRHAWRASVEWCSWRRSSRDANPLVPPDVEAEMREAMAVALAALPLVVG